LTGVNGSTNYFYTKDHLGSICEAVGPAGLLATRYNYDPYGQRAVVQENFQTTLGFTGDFVHHESGLYLTWLRPFDSSSGRWLSRDPIAESGGINLYAYVGNSPMINTDPFGVIPGWKVCICSFGIVIALVCPASCDPGHPPPPVPCTGQACGARPKPRPEPPDKKPPVSGDPPKCTFIPPSGPGMSGPGMY